jgi:RNA polymerase sigma-70 factor (ECF subfamily)
VEALAHEADRAAVGGGRPDADAALVAAAKAGDAAAFGELYERHRDGIYRFCLARTGSIPDAEDLTADVFVKALRSLERYEQRGTPFIAFLYRIARNAAIDRARSRRRNPSAEELSPAIPSGHNVERAAIAGTDRTTLLAALARLKQSDREVIVLRLIEGYSGLEVAEMLGRSEGAVRILQHRAMERLRKTFAEAEADANKKKVRA